MHRAILSFILLSGLFLQNTLHSEPHVSPSPSPKKICPTFQGSLVTNIDMVVFCDGGSRLRAQKQKELQEFFSAALKKTILDQLPSKEIKEKFDELRNHDLELLVKTVTSVHRDIYRLGYLKDPNDGKEKYIFLEQFGLHPQAWHVGAVTRMEHVEEANEILSEHKVIDVQVVRAERLTYFIRPLRERYEESRLASIPDDVPLINFYPFFYNCVTEANMIWRNIKREPCDLSNLQDR